MLTALRSRTGTWIVRILFGLLVLSFAFWGLEGVLHMQTARPIATVGDIRITAREYAVEFERAVQRLRGAFGPDFDAEKARRFGLPQQVMSQLISRALFDSEADRLGLTVADAQVADAIRANTMFHDEGGRFNRIRFEELLRSNSLTEAQFADMLRGDLSRRQLVLSVASGITGPEPFARTLYTYRNERRVARYVPVPVSAARDVLPPGEADLRAYYDKNRAAFARPEHRKATFFTVRAEDLAASTPVPEEDLRQAYESRLPSFTRPEGRDFQQMLFQTREQAENAAAKLRSGADPAVTAKSVAGLMSSTEVKGASREELLPEVAEAVFATKAGDVAGPVESPLGWVVARVTGANPAQTRAFEEVREELHQSLAAERAGDKLYEMANQIQDEQAGGATLEEIAKKLGVPVQTVEAVDRSGKGPDGKPAAGLPDSPKFLDTAFEADVRQELDPLELPGGGYLLLRVDGITPAVTPPFEQIREQVAQAWQADARREGARKLADSLAQRAREGADLAALAGEIGQAVHDVGPAARDYTDDALPPEFVQALFRAKESDVFTGPGADQGYVIAQVAKVLPADPAANAEALRTVRTDLASAMTEDVLRQYQVALEKRLGVDVDMEAAQKAIGQGQED